MTFSRRQSHIVLFTAILVSTQIAWLPAIRAGGDHGSGSEFKNEGNAGNATVKVDREMASKLGLKIEPVRQQSFGSSIKATGQLEALPSQKSEITAPVKGKIISLAVQPGATVKRGQTLAVMNSADLADLRVTSQEKTAEAKSTLQQAQVDLRLAQDNYRQYQQIAAAEISQAKSQLIALQSLYNRDRSVVNQRSILNAAQASYQQQQQIAKSGIEQAQVELAVAQERYDRDRQLMASGALAQRQVLESQAKLAEVKNKLAKAKLSPELAQARIEVQKAEVELPLRQQQESAGKLAEAQANLTKAMTQKEVVAARSQMHRAQAAMTAAQSKLALSNTSYQTRLQQLGTSANTLGQVVVTAPIDGVVADWDTTPGQSVQDAGAKLMTIVNGSQVLVTANIYEKDLAQVKLGQSVNVRVIGLKDKTFTGTISRIGAVVGEGRVVPVQAQLNNVSGELKPGMSAELAVMTGQSGRAVIAVPRTAIVDVNGQKLVYVQTGEDGFKSAIVELGETSGDRVEVKQGLAVGDRVVTQRTTQLYAQSLRGEAPADEHGDEKAGEHGDENKATPQKLAKAETLATIPPWVWGAGMGLLMGGTAWILYRRRQQNAIAIDEVELVMNHHVLPNAADAKDFDRDRGIEPMADRQRN